MRNALTIRGIVHTAHGRFDEAVALMDRCVDLLRDREPDWLLATSLLNLGQATTYAGEARALSLLKESHDLYADLGDEHYAARTLVYSGYASLPGGNDDAASYFRRSLITFWELDDMWGTTEALEGCAAIAGSKRSSERAATIAGAAEALRETINARQFPADAALMRRNLDAAKATMNDTSWREAWETGRGMAPEQAVDYALESI
jgi:hypothetical protein